jgi:aminoglycoside phosphotransferase
VDPTLSLLTSDEAYDVLSAAVGTAGGDLVEWRPNQVDHRPGASTTVAYRATVRWGDVVQRETLAASSGLGDDQDVPDGVLVLGDGDRQVAVWRFPSDPALPALAAACDQRVVGDLLTSLGVSGIAPDASNVRLRVRSYRPRRRAVVEVRAGRVRLFLKVARPQVVADLRHRHRLLHGAGVPVPRCLGWSDDGLLVLEALTGTSARHRAQRGGLLPTGRHLTDLLDRLPPETMQLAWRRPWAEHAEHYAQVIGSAVPAERDRVTHLATAITTGLSGAQPDVPTHGDFHEGQLVLDGERVTGLLDVDTVGPGRRADDLACLLAHTHVLALASGTDAELLMSALRTWRGWFDRVVDPAELRLRTAGVLLSLATGPHRVQERGWPEATTRRVDAAQWWVETSEGR